MFWQMFVNGFTYIFNRSLIGTRLKPVGASHLLPIFDDVHLKAIFSVSVARPRETRVLSNMPLSISKNMCVFHAANCSCVNVCVLGRLYQFEIAKLSSFTIVFSTVFSQVETA